jgi:hypothetical protein
MMGMMDRWLDASRYMTMETKDQIKEDRSVCSKEDFIDGVFDDFVPSGYYNDFDNNNAVVSEDDEEHKKRV